ncbi:hypothetical protein SNR37_002221 [Agarivorans aestuarii]|uniref:Sulfotransferase domain-containing protein n=1 Tax=Agarivorans aestuarii TaxID=1563703 RepID=A0ABU7G0F3_9ALTE|nr:hypothetical protein [Agarivorans aestuarii]MEE1672811.1 hypothetical protein [Agarivorans aestuarii]
MPKLIIHIGTHKTGTTTIQHQLYNSRDALLSNGILYPTYAEFLNKKDHYAHLDIAKAIMNESKVLSLKDVKTFFDNVYSYSVSHNIGTVIISAEPFYRGKLVTGDGEYWEGRLLFIEKLRSLIPFEDIELALVFRRQDNYLESLYNEHIKVTRYSKDIFSFYSDFSHRFDYKRQIEVWRKVFPIIKVETFENLISNKSLTEDFLKFLGVDFEGEIVSLNHSSNVSWPVELVELKRILNGSYLKNSELDNFRKIFSGKNLNKTMKFVNNGTRLSSEYRRFILETHEADNDHIARDFIANDRALFNMDISNNSVLSNGYNVESAVALLYRIHSGSKDNVK